MSDLTFEVTEYPRGLGQDFHDKQQRFEAALVFTADALKEGFAMEHAIELGVETADKLISKLKETDDD